MDGGTGGWVLASGVIVAGLALAFAAALGETVRERWRAWRRADQIPPPLGLTPPPPGHIQLPPGHTPSPPGHTPPPPDLARHGDWVLDDPGRAARLFIALCHMRRELLARDLPMPAVAVVLVGHGRVIVRLTRPAPVPPVPPWRAEAGDPTGQAWVVDTADLQQPEAGPFPCPMLTVIGRSGGWSILVDLSQEPGCIALTGHPGGSRQVVGRLAVRLATDPWSRKVRVVTGDLDDLAVPEPGRVTSFTSPDEALAHAEGLCEQPAPKPLALLLGHPASDASRLRRLGSDPLRCVVVAGRIEVTPASWSIDVSADGRMSLGPLGPVLEPIDDPGYQPGAAASLAPGAAGAPRPPEAPATDGRDRPPHGVQVGVLGALQVSAPGSDMPREPLASLVAMAAISPAGVPAPVVAAMLGGAEAVSAAVRDLHDWLGADQTCLPRWREQDGAWHLAPDVWVDLRRFAELVGDVGPVSEPARLAAALALIRGELLSGLTLTPVARQAIEGPLADIHRLVVRAARRAAELAAGAGDPAAAHQAVRTALMLLPREEELWRGLLEFEVRYRPAAARQTAAEMMRALAPSRGRRRELERTIRDLLARHGVRSGPPPRGSRR